jgi:UDP-N-acetylglucosamine 2-epimerase (non-hydrolysing)
MRVLHVVGARPNFMKAAPVITAFHQRGVSQTLVHTGQHYDALMSDVFFRQLGLPEPDINLGVGSGSHGAQTGEIMARLEPLVSEQRPDLALVYGDVNSTLAGALVCSKLGIPVGHVEAGLRSFDRTMPEEINRVVTDHIADLLFTPSEDGDRNLRSEGIDSRKIFQVGNVMIDTLVNMLPLARRITRDDGLFSQRYALVTLHRPSNVDDPERLREIMRALIDVGEELTVVFPVHPRTRKQIGMIGLADLKNIRLLDPVGYVEFLALQANAAVVITDSGGIQEETTFLRVPCLTVRSNTERPVTVTSGTNMLVGDNPSQLLVETHRILAGRGKRGRAPQLWDGRAAYRIVDVVLAGLPALDMRGVPDGAI